MSSETIASDFSQWLTITHALNFLFLSFLVRSGIQILFDHPRLYWNDHCIPGSEWIRFTNKDVPKDSLYTSLDDSCYISPWIALPGGRHALGTSRHWHFCLAFFWILNGLVYVSFLFSTGAWRRLVPTSWDSIPEAWRAFLAYASFQLPPQTAYHPYDPLQMRTYAGIVFLLSPFMILTGITMSPALGGNFPWLIRLFDGWQKARSFHFIGMILFLVFFVIHVSLVVITGFSTNMVHIILGKMERNEHLAITLFWIGLIVIIGINVVATVWSKRAPNTPSIRDAAWF